MRALNAPAVESGRSGLGESPFDHPTCGERIGVTAHRGGYPVLHHVDTFSRVDLLRGAGEVPVVGVNGRTSWRRVRNHAPTKALTEICQQCSKGPGIIA